MQNTNMKPASFLEKIVIDDFYYDHQKAENSFGAKITNIVRKIFLAYAVWFFKKDIDSTCGRCQIFERQFLNEGSGVLENIDLQTRKNLLKNGIPRTALPDSLKEKLTQAFIQENRSESPTILEESKCE